MAWSLYLKHLWNVDCNCVCWLVINNVWIYSLIYNKIYLKTHCLLLAWFGFAVKASNMFCLMVVFILVYRSMVDTTWWNLDIVWVVCRETTMASRIAARYVSRRLSSGKVLSEEEKAAENVYIKVLSMKYYVLWLQ